jgi:hypothetical protein
MALRKEAEALAAEKRSAMIEEARAMKVNTRASWAALRLAQRRSAQRDGALAG